MIDFLQNRGVRRIAAFAFVLIVVPWLNPFAPGPAPAVVPLLLTWTCIAFLLGGMSLQIGQLDHRDFVSAVARAWMLAALISAALGQLQYFGYTSGLSPWVSSTPIGEAFGNLRQRNQFATLCSVGLLALLWHVACWRPDPLDNRPADRGAGAMRWFNWSVAMLLLAGANAASGSRTGLLQWWLIAGLGVVWRCRGGVKRPLSGSHGRVAAIALSALVVYCMCLFLLPWLLTEKTGFKSDGLFGRLKQDGGCGSRTILWSNVLHLIAQKPWVGWGWGELDFAHFNTLYPNERFCDILDNAHNLPLHLAVELGVPFAVFVFTCLGWLVYRAKPWLETDPTRQMAWGVLAVMGLHSLVEYPLWYGPFQMAAALSVWLLWVIPAHSDRPAGVSQCDEFRTRNWPLTPVLAASFATFLIVALFFTAWDYWRVSQLYLPQADRATAYRDGTLDKVRNSWLFQDQVQFAELTTTPFTAANAAQLNALAKHLLHFSPEPRVVEKLIESAVMLGRDDEALFYLQRFRAAFPREHASWAKESARQEAP